METRLDRIVRAVLLAPLMPVIGLLGFWWVSYAWLAEAWIPYLSFGGLLMGILADTFLLKRLLNRKLSLWTWAVVFLFYSICIFSFFMGVPVINAVISLPAGYVAGSRLAAEKAGRVQLRKTALGVAWFTTIILILICAASAIIALVSPSTGSDLRGMLGLNFEVTRSMLTGLILIGGALVAVDWALSLASVHFTYRLMNGKI